MQYGCMVQTFIERKESTVGWKILKGSKPQKAKAFRLLNIKLKSNFLSHSLEEDSLI